MVPIIIIPGWRDSGPGHWQSLWAEQLPGAVRVQQDDWITPSKTAWTASIARTILNQASPVVVVAHSLGCIATTPIARCAPPVLMPGPGAVNSSGCKMRGTSILKQGLAHGHWGWHCYSP